MQAVDLFAGAGGMSTGASWSGVRVAYAVELETTAAETYRINHPHTILIDQDIRNVTADAMPNLNRSEPLVVFGGPPCQGFSTSNQKSRDSKNPKNWLFLQYTRLVEELAPDWIVFENVIGLAETEKGSFLVAIIESFKKIGYKISSFTLNAAEYGVPQRRRRLFIIGSREGKTVQPPPSIINKPITVNDAIGDLPPLSNGASFEELPYSKLAHTEYADTMRKGRQTCGSHLVTKNADHVIKRYAHIPPGGNWENIPEELMHNYADRSRCHTGIYYRLKADAPSIVVGNFRKNMLIHPHQDRGLSVREAARLQSFPDDYTFAGSIGFQQQQVGNAVPPLLAKVIFDLLLVG
jgi:DNA (cytosine-5)-methyltransferase 1